MLPAIGNATLCGDRRGRGAKTRGFFAFLSVRARPSAGIGVVEVQKLEVFCFFVGARALRGSAWSRCKNSRFFAFLTFPDEPSAGIGQKLEVFCVFDIPR